MRRRFAILTSLVIFAGFCCACLPVDRAAAILGYVPAEEPGLVNQFEELLNALGDQFDD